MCVGEPFEIRKESVRKKYNATNNCRSILEKKSRGLCLENSLSFVFNKERLQTDLLQTLAAY